MVETLLSIVLVLAILGVSALLTHWFARAMYITCPHCRTLNARRRVQCRKCGGELRHKELEL
jgi:ribosomal protein L40E